ncbi:MAG: hypothetical protein ABR924_06555 [Terracidiphilus sp.]|jgi:hypothetical protein
MTTYFKLNSPDSALLEADDSKMESGLKAQRVFVPCPITNEHNDGSRRISLLYLQVSHNRREELMIWYFSWNSGFVIHEQLLEEFAREGFTGYRIKPATVRFRDGSVSTEYREFIVTGWAGIAPSESGIHVVESCPACHWKHYSGITNYEKVIDWSQWTGEDFFIVWPLPLFKLITNRVAQWLKSHKVKSFRLSGLVPPHPPDEKFGYTVSRLSNFLPEDLAIKYGGPLNLG